MKYISEQLNLNCTDHLKQNFGCAINNGIRECMVLINVFLLLYINSNKRLRITENRVIVKFGEVTFAMTD